MRIFKDTEDVRAWIVEQMDKADADRGKYRRYLTNWEIGDRSVAKTGGLGKTEILENLARANGRYYAYREVMFAIDDIDETAYNELHLRLAKVNR